MLAKGLREQAYAVDVAIDGNAAIYQSSITDYDAVVLDVMLPGPDGLQVCRELRKRGSPVPVLMLTARDAVEDRIAGLDSGADDYLAKPFAFGELLARLRAVIRRGARPPVPEVIHVGDLRLDTAARHVQRRNRVVPLTAREYALLEYLAHRAGAVVSRADIAEHVWDEHYDPLSNVIDVYVQRLRRKVDLPGQDSLIRTRRGEGYQLRIADPSNNMSLGIHGRLTALYAAAVLAALTLCGAGLYALVFRLELSSVDEDLQRASSTTAFSMKAEEDEGLTLDAAAKDTEGELRIAGITVAIYDAQAHLLAARWEDLAPASVGPGGVPEGISTLPHQPRRVAHARDAPDVQGRRLRAAERRPAQRREPARGADPHGLS